MLSIGTLLDRSTIIVVAVADDDGTTAASPLRAPGGTRTFVRYCELHSRPCSRSYRTSGSAEQHGSAVLLSQMHSAHRAPESAQPPPEMLHLAPRSTPSNTPCSSASRSLEQQSHTAQGARGNASPAPTASQPSSTQNDRRRMQLPRPPSSAKGLLLQQWTISVCHGFR